MMCCQILIVCLSSFQARIFWRNFPYFTNSPSLHDEFWMMLRLLQPAPIFSRSCFIKIIPALVFKNSIFLNCKSSGICDSQTKIVGIVDEKKYIHSSCIFLRCSSNKNKVLTTMKIYQKILILANTNYVSYLLMRDSSME